MRKGRERSKRDVFYYSVKLLLYEIKMENPKKKKFLSNYLTQIGIFLYRIGKKHTFLHWKFDGAEFRPQNRVIESPDIKG